MSAISIAMDAFYEELTPLYHLIFPNWDESIRRQGESLAGLIRGGSGLGLNKFWMSRAA
jgi:hypothetical protein